MSDIGGPRPISRAKDGLNPRSKAPQQERSQQRVAAVIQAAEAMVAEVGPEATSIPDVARLSGVPRSSIYQFFPDKYVLFATIAERHLANVAAAVAAVGGRRPTVEYSELIALLIEAVSDYYDATPIASILVLGGPFSQEAYLAQATNIRDVGREFRVQLANRPTPVLVPEQPDVATLAVEIAFACMKHGYYRENRLSPMTRREAARAASAYIACFI